MHPTAGTQDGRGKRRLEVAEARAQGCVYRAKELELHPEGGAASKWGDSLLVCGGEEGLGAGMF